MSSSVALSKRLPRIVYFPRIVPLPGIDHLPRIDKWWYWTRWFEWYERVSLQRLDLFDTDNLYRNLRLPLESSKYGKIKNFSLWLPELDPEHPSAQKFHTKISNRTTAFCIQQLTAALVLVTNIALTAWAHARFGTHNGIGTIYLGSCAKAQRLDIWLHLLINVLSTLLLGASNFCMQLLVAPTRHEVDKAHEKSFWLDIGTPSVRNLRKIARVRVLTWLCLGFSSALLHLSYVF